MIRLPLNDLVACSLQNPSSDRYDQSCFLRDPYEGVWCYPAALRMVPSDQSLKLVDGISAKIDDRLIKDLEFVALDRTSEVGFQLESAELARMYLTLEYLVAGLAGILRAVHCDVRVAKKILSFAKDLIGKDDANTGTREHFVIVQIECGGEHLLQTLGNVNNRSSIAGTRKQDR